MTSQLRHNFQASQAVHGADDIMTPRFSQVNSLSICGPQVLFTAEGWSAQPYSANFETVSIFSLFSSVKFTALENNFFTLSVLSSAKQLS